jgi:RNA 2',3'-cyclic 3'-phosphodiesterase
MRCFVAVDVSLELREKLAEIGNNFRDNGVKLTKPENFHFTIKFLGEISEERSRDVSLALKKLKFEPFEITISGIGAFPSTRFPHIIWAGCNSQEMNMLANNVDAITVSLGFPKENEYASHITLARIKYPQKGMQEKLEQMNSMEIGKMRVDSICLKQSLLLKKGPVYKDIARIYLGF